MSRTLRVSSDKSIDETGITVDHVDTRLLVVVEDQARRWREVEGPEVEEPRTAIPQFRLQRIVDRLGYLPDSAPCSFGALMQWLRHVQEKGHYKETYPMYQWAEYHASFCHDEKEFQNESDHERDREEVVTYIKENFGGEKSKIIEWMENTKIPGFDMTAEELLQKGRRDDLMRHLERRKYGGYA